VWESTQGHAYNDTLTTITNTEARTEDVSTCAYVHRMKKIAKTEERKKRKREITDWFEVQDRHTLLSERK